MDIERLRAETPGCASRLHVNNAGASLLSEATIEAMTSHLRSEAETGGYEASDAAAESIQAVYAGIADLVGGLPHQVALMDNSTHAWNAAAYSVPLRRGDRVLTGRAEYGSSVLAWWQIAQRSGAEIVVVPDDETGQLDVEALRGLIDDRTRVIDLTWVPTSGGLVNPAAEVGRLAREADVLYILDATQAVGQLHVDVQALGCDVLTGTGRKFVRGPRGTGFLWVGERALERLEPHVVEIRSAMWDGGRGFTWEAGARRFETWENSYLNVLGLGAAVQQALALGVPAIEERTTSLGRLLREELAAVPGVSVHDQGTRQCAIVTAAVRGMAAADVAAALAADHINVSITVAEHSPFDTEARGVHPLVRLSPHYFNTEAEMHRTADAVASLAMGAR